MQPLYKLKDYKETFRFEREHPKQLRWDDKYKLWMLEQNEKCQGIWLKDKTHGVVAEMIMSWESDNVLHIDSITVLPEFRRKGLATKLINLALEWGENMGYQYMVGEARKGSSWNVFENMGATPVLLHKNWNETQEDYMSFKMEI
jgi:ribosomal protein S18 acetylase RimI-like enzyme